MPKKIAATHTRKLAHVQALPLLCIHHTQDDDGNAIDNVLDNAQPAWDNLGRWRSSDLYDLEDGSYGIGTSAHYPTFTLCPAGHKAHTRALEKAALREQQRQVWMSERWRVLDLCTDRAVIIDEQGQAQEITRLDGCGFNFHSALRKGNRLPLDVLKHARTYPVGYTVQPYEPLTFTQPDTARIPAVKISACSTSRAMSDDVGSWTEFTGADCWQQFEVKRQAVVAGLRQMDWMGGVEKTDVVIEFADGYTLSTRMDISDVGSDSGTLEQHLLEKLHFNAGLYQPAHMDEQQYTQALKWTEDHLPALVVQAHTTLPKYRIGTLPSSHKPRARYWQDGSPCPQERTEISAADLAEVEAEARAELTPIYGVQQTEAAIRAVRENRVLLTDTAPVWLSSPHTPQPGRVMN